MDYNYLPVGIGTVSSGGGSNSGEDASLSGDGSVSDGCASQLGDEPDGPSSVVSPGRAAVGCGKPAPGLRQSTFLISVMVCALFCACATAAPVVLAAIAPPYRSVVWGHIPTAPLRWSVEWNYLAQRLSRSSRSAAKGGIREQSHSRCRGDGSHPNHPCRTEAPTSDDEEEEEGEPSSIGMAASTTPSNFLTHDSPAAGEVDFDESAQNRRATPQPKMFRSGSELLGTFMLSD
eukprot:gene5456-6612_t